jgi:hypothetical protein
MNAFEFVLKNHKECVVYYNEKARTRLTTLATLISIRQVIKKSGATAHFQPVDNISEFEDSAESDWSKVYCYLDVKKEGTVLLYSHFDEEHVYGVANITYTHEFANDENGILSQIDSHEEVPLDDLWLMVTGNANNKLLKALIADRLIQFYNNRVGLVDNLIKTAHPNIFNIYLHVLDYCKRHRLRIHTPKKKAKDSHKVKKKGVVVTINQTDTFDDTYLKYGFERHPEAGFIINYWNDGVMQIMNSKEPEFRHVDLLQSFNLLMEEFRHKLEKKIIPLSTIKWVLKDNQNPLLEFEFEQFLNLKPHVYYGTRSNTNSILNKKDVYLVDYEEFTPEMWSELDSIGLNLYDLLEITTKKSVDELLIVALIFYGKQHRPNMAHKLFSIEKGVKLSSILRQKFIKMLNQQSPEPEVIKERIDEIRPDIITHMKKHYEYTEYKENFCTVKIIQLVYFLGHLTICFELYYSNENYINELRTIQNKVEEQMRHLYGLKNQIIDWSCDYKDYG